MKKAEEEELAQMLEAEGVVTLDPEDEEAISGNHGCIAGLAKMIKSQLPYQAILHERDMFNQVHTS